MGTLQPNLVPLCELKALLEPAIAVTLLGQGGLQIGEVAEAHITGSRFSGVMIGTASDWLTIARDGSWGRMDVRGSFKADDGAIFVRYGGCIRFDRHEASASLVVAATFENRSRLTRLAEFSSSNRQRALEPKDERALV
jgi:hypothetical protein